MEQDHVSDGSKETSDVSDAGEKKDSDTVDHATYKKLLNQLKKTQEENKSLFEKVGKLSDYEQRLADIENEKTKKKENELVQKGEFKKLLELREQEIANLSKKLQDKDHEVTNSRKDLHDTWKSLALQNALPGKIKRTEYFNFVDFEKIAIDPESGRPDPQSVQAVAEDFMKNYSDLVDTSHVKGMPGTAPGSGNNFNTVDRFKEMGLKDMKSNLKSLVAKEKQKLGLI